MAITDTKKPCGKTQKLLPTFLFCLLANLGFSQIYSDYLGAGHNVGVITKGSSDTVQDTSVFTVSGTQLKPDLIGASRFLAQATLGASYEDMVQVSNIGIDPWLEEQFNLPALSFAERYDEVYEETQALITNDGHNNHYLSFVFYDFLLKEPDALRQKLAFALSQIFVISPYHGSNLLGESNSNITYYDFLYQGAFGNYKNLLTNITLSAPMGKYLSHFKNQKADWVEKTFPDENYAREVMQLFSIGLHQLNLNGTPKLDAAGNTIPTYDIDDIAEMAKVFTGLAAAEAGDGTENINFFRTYDFNKKIPLKMFEDYHAKGTKEILPGVTIPAGQSGMQDIHQTLDILYNHPNVGPFISKRLIQQFVKSNPTPAYVKRVAIIFNNNGNGVRGDLKSVVKAILLDPEARDCEWITHPDNGKLIQPIERFITIYKAFDLTTPSGKIWISDFNEFYEATGQSFMASPSVFNFFNPFYAEDEFVSPKNLVSPEFQILNSVTAIAYINKMESAIKARPFKNRTLVNDLGENLTLNPDDEPILDLSDELNIYNEEGVNVLLDRLNLILCRGQLSTGTKNIIANTILENEEKLSSYTNESALHDALYYIMMSPDYIIQK